MLDVDAEDVFELAASDDQHPIEALAPDSADPALQVSVRVRRSDRFANDHNLLARQEGVESSPSHAPFATHRGEPPGR